jgi:hypothetical protein
MIIIFFMESVRPFLQYKGAACLFQTAKIQNILVNREYLKKYFFNDRTAYWQPQGDSPA